MFLFKLETLTKNEKTIIDLHYNMFLFKLFDFLVVDDELFLFTLQYVSI